MNRGKILLLGILMGAGGLVMYLRLRQIIESGKPERVINDINRRLDGLEAQIDQVSA